MCRRSRDSRRAGISTLPMSPLLRAGGTKPNGQRRKDIMRGPSRSRVTLPRPFDRGRVRLRGSGLRRDDHAPEPEPRARGENPAHGIRRRRENGERTRRRGPLRRFVGRIPDLRVRRRSRAEVRSGASRGGLRKRGLGRHVRASPEGSVGKIYPATGACRILVRSESRDAAADRGTPASKEWVVELVTDEPTKAAALGARN